MSHTHDLGTADGRTRRRFFGDGLSTLGAALLVANALPAAVARAAAGGASLSSRHLATIGKLADVAARPAGSRVPRGDGPAAAREFKRRFDALPEQARAAVAYVLDQFEDSAPAGFSALDDAQAREFLVSAMSEVPPWRADLEQRAREAAEREPKARSMAEFRAQLAAQSAAITAEKQRIAREHGEDAVRPDPETGFPAYAPAAAEPPALPPDPLATPAGRRRFTAITAWNLVTDLYYPANAVPPV